MPGYLPPILTAVIAGSVAVSAYLFNGHLSRVAEKRRAYAEAMKCVEQYIQLPHTYYRRVDDEPATLKELTAQLARIQVELAFHKQWLTLDDPGIGAAYLAWCRVVESVNRGFREQAIADGPAMEVPRGIFKTQSATERDECVRLMRRHLTIRGQLGMLRMRARA